MLATQHRIGLDAEQAEQAADRGADAFLQCARVGQCVRIRRREGTQDRQRAAGLGARRVDRDVGGRLESRDAFAVLVPVGESLAPVLGRLGRVRRRLEPFARGFAGIDPGREVLGAQFRERQQQVGDVAFRVDHNRRDAVERGFLEQRQAQAGLAAAGHADADGVGGQVARVVEQVFVRRDVAGS